MAKIFQGNVSLIRNTKGDITVVADPDGKFSNENVTDLYNAAQDFAKKLKATIRIFKPEPNGNTPLLLTSSYGKPYLALLPESKAPSKAKVVKLA